MAPKPETIRARMTRRVETALKTHRVAEAHFDPETGAGVIMAQNKDKKLVALFFDPAVTRHFDEVEISAHERINLGAVLKQRLADQKAKLMKPHDFKPGDIFHHSYGAGSRYNSFYRVIGIPAPTQIEAVPLPLKVLSGTITSGSVVPDIDAQETSSQKESVTFDILMQDRGPSLRTKGDDWKTTFGTRWDGKPKYNYED